MLIGVAGQLGSGKDSFLERAQYLYDCNDLPIESRPLRRAFADKLKQAFSVLFMVHPEFLEEAKRDDFALVQIRRPRYTISRRAGLTWTRHLPGMMVTVTSQTVRSGLQRLGSEVGRDIFGGSFWIDQALPRDFDHSRDVIMVSDVRFSNEADRIRELGGVVVRVLNGPLLQDGHLSEQILDDSLIDYEVDNSRRDDHWKSLDAAAAHVFHQERITQAAPPSTDPPKQRLHTPRKLMDPTYRLKPSRND